MYVQKLVNDDNAFHFFISLLNQRLKIDMSTGTIYDFSVRDNSGDLVSLDKYSGLVVIIVNVASYCGLTNSNYKELKSLNDKYHLRGLRVAAFPCNQFGFQACGLN
ncbi:Glutathione peroxidase [Caenorhabditis elegans]|uniref:Glutathione peroxidase n=1 Tax=Caenorhabditis elegans TaxID=6239 RepID=A8WFK7_CAEEL|nr:Glutathione peroxidase [Caenorhabditis elegans]CCD68029.1 Glutathione peroxidase [Caenorhabditis elegans]|eukprot:NP_001123172.1 Glutathione peroxidase [Caenorhabditis elegans]